jgi:uncharacterized membrane protein HdeD (DUF308 family)
MEVNMLSRILSEYWWTTLLRGVVWILFGIMVIAMPGISLVTLTLMFGAFALVDGVANVVSAFGGRKEATNWWMLLLAGVAGIIVGVLTFLTPGITAMLLLMYIAFWAIITGVLEILTAIKLRKEIEGEFWLALAGVASIAFGAFVIARPGAGVLAVLSLIAAYAIVLGAILVILAFKARGFVTRLTDAMRRPRPSL